MVEGCQYSPGRCPNLLSRLLSDESGKGALFAAQNLFSTILKLGSTANPKLSACGGSDPAEGIAIWHVKSGMVLIDNVDIFNDDMFCDLGCQVNELDIVVELIKGFNPVVIF